VLLQTYNMAQLVDIPTRTHKTSSRAIDNIFIDYTRINFFQISPSINGLSDHNTQYLILTNVFTKDRGVSTAYRTCLITKDSISTFLGTLSNKSLLTHFSIQFRLSSNHVPIQTTTLKFSNDGCITKGIGVSCRCIKGLYIF